MFIIIPIILMAVLLYLIFGLKPTILLLRKMFSSDGELKYPADCEEEKLKVEIQCNLTYPSVHGKNDYDLYLPQKMDHEVPVIIWIHGGGFIAGGKDSAKNWSKMLADAGYAVAAVDYEYAPEISYPEQLRQIQEFIKELKKRRGEGLPIDINRVYLAGDSAGAHIAAQCALCATNPDFEKEIGIHSELHPDELKGTLLYCGPYNIEVIFSFDNKFAQFIFGKIGWAFFGTTKWRKNHIFKTTTIKDYVTSAFPPSFITDGNNGSFEKDGKELAEKLKSLGVMTSELFFDESEGEIGHIYQYDLSSKAGYVCYQKTLEFLESVEADAMKEERQE